MHLRAGRRAPLTGVPSCPSPSAAPRQRPPGGRGTRGAAPSAHAQGTEAFLQL